MRLIIQIPCYNEEATLATTLKELPRKLDGIDDIKWLIINDGSSDKTELIAKENGVDYIVTHKKNLGLARAFVTGLNASLKYDADIIVNTDADNQYCAKDIGKLVQPIIEKKADIVIGARPISKIEHFSPIKKILQNLGSYVVRSLSNTDVPDAPSGFRAFSKEAAQRINVFSDYTYTLETIIQAGQKNMAITWVPIRVNGNLRPSRLMKSTTSYIKNSLFTITRIFIVYRPFRFFISLGSVLFLSGFCLGLRFLFFYCTGNSTGHIQSLILSSILLGMGFQTMLIAFLADLLAVNRKLLEDTSFLLKKIESSKE